MRSSPFNAANSTTDARCAGNVGAQTLAPPSRRFANDPPFDDVADDSSVTPAIRIRAGSCPKHDSEAGTWRSCHVRLDISCALFWERHWHEVPDGLTLDVGNVAKPVSDSEEPPTSLCSDEDDDAPQYVGCIHQVPAQSNCSGFLCNTGESSALVVFGEFEGHSPRSRLPADDSRDALRA